MRDSDSHSDSAGSMEHVTVKPYRVRVPDVDLGTIRLRGVGFRAESDAGWRGPVRVVRQDAVRDLHDYKAELSAARGQGEAVQATPRAEAS